MCICGCVRCNDDGIGIVSDSVGAVVHMCVCYKIAMMLMLVLVMATLCNVS